MGRWANSKANNAAVTDAILLLNSDPNAGLKQLSKLADDAAKHDRGDAEVMRKLVAGHQGLAG